MTKKLASVFKVRNLKKLSIRGITVGVFKFYLIIFLTHCATSFAKFDRFSSDVIRNSVERCEHKPHMVVERNLQVNEWKIITLFEIWGKPYCSHIGRHCGVEKIQFPSNVIII